MKKSTPGISVIMANYNHGDYIDEALEGLVNQTLLPSEIIIIDDGSEDESCLKIRYWKSRYPDLIRDIYHEKNQGVLATIEEGLKKSSYDFVMFHSSDDLLRTRCLELYNEMLMKYPEAGFCCSDPTYFKNDATDCTYIDIFEEQEATYFSPEEVAERLSGQWIPGYTLLRKKLLKKAGGIIHGLKWNADWFWLLVMAFRYGCCYIPETLALNRDLEDSYLKRGKGDSKAMEAVYDLVLDLLQGKEYRDVLPYFTQSSALSNFNSPLARHVLRKPIHWNSRILSLVQSNINSQSNELVAKQSHNRERNTRYDSLLISSLMNQVINYCELKKYKSIGLYGEEALVRTILKELKNNEKIRVPYVIGDRCIKSSVIFNVKAYLLEEKRDFSDVDALIICDLERNIGRYERVMNRGVEVPLVPLWNPREGYFSERLSNGLRKIVPWVIANLKERKIEEKIVIYGAGKHTEMLLDFWRENEGPSIESIITTKESEIKDLKGIPVQSLKNVDRKSVNAVIVSSYSYKKEMTEQVVNKFGEEKLVRLW